jgi:biopolymer transport protein ExbD
VKRSAFIVLAVLLAVLLAGATSAVEAQSPSQPQPSAAKTQEPATVQKTRSVDPRDSVSIADVQRAADDLVFAVQQAVKKVTDNPELKIAALKLATNAVNAAQVVVAQQASTLQAALESLAKEVATATAQQTKPKTH